MAIGFCCPIAAAPVVLPAQRALLQRGSCSEHSRESDGSSECFSNVCLVSHAVSVSRQLTEVYGPNQIEKTTEIDASSVAAFYVLDEELMQWHSHRRWQRVTALFEFTPECS